MFFSHDRAFRCEKKEAACLHVGKQSRVLMAGTVFYGYATMRVIHIHSGAVSTNMKMLKASVEVPVRTYCW